MATELIRDISRDTGENIEGDYNIGFRELGMRKNSDISEEWFERKDKPKMRNEINYIDSATLAYKPSESLHQQPDQPNIPVFSSFISQKSEESNQDVSENRLAQTLNETPQKLSHDSSLQALLASSDNRKCEMLSRKPTFKRLESKLHNYKPNSIKKRKSNVLNGHIKTRRTSAPLDKGLQRYSPSPSLTGFKLTKKQRRTEKQKQSRFLNTQKLFDQLAQTNKKVTNGLVESDCFQSICTGDKVSMSLHIPNQALQSKEGKNSLARYLTHKKARNSHTFASHSAFRSMKQSTSTEHMPKKEVMIPLSSRQRGTKVSVAKQDLKYKETRQSINSQVDLLNPLRQSKYNQVHMNKNSTDWIGEGQMFKSINTESVSKHSTHSSNHPLTNDNFQTKATAHRSRLSKYLIDGGRGSIACKLLGKAKSSKLLKKASYYADPK